MEFPTMPANASWMRFLAAAANLSEYAIIIEIPKNREMFSVVMNGQSAVATSRRETAAYLNMLTVSIEPSYTLLPIPYVTTTGKFLSTQEAANTLNARGLAHSGKKFKTFTMPFTNESTTALMPFTNESKSALMPS